MQILHTKLFVLGRGVHDNVSFLFSSLFLFVHNKQPHTHTHQFYSKAKTHIQRQKKKFLNRIKERQKNIIIFDVNQNHECCLHHHHHHHHMMIDLFHPSYLHHHSLHEFYVDYFHYQMYAIELEIFFLHLFLF